jgi:hypothetical protein
MIVATSPTAISLGTSTAGLLTSTGSYNTLRVSQDPFIPPIVTSTPVVTGIPLVPRRYQDLNTDPEVRQRMTSYFYGKLYDQWMYSDFRFMLKNLKVSGNKIRVSRAKDKNASESDIQAKIDFLKNRVFDREKLYRLLVVYTNRSRSNWYDLKANKQHVKNLLRHKVAFAIRKLL